MQYIQLNDNSYVLHLSTGLRTIKRRSFNFHKIQKLINEGADVENILPLLEVPPLPNGTYEAYELPEGKMIYLHTSEKGVQTLNNLVGEKAIPYTLDQLVAELKFVGIYASIEDLEEDWPEYLL